MGKDPAKHDNLRMPRWIRWWIHGAGLLCLVSGVLWLLFHHFMSVEGEFGPAAHPLERTWIVVHGAAAVLAAWVLGLIWMGHVRRGLGFGRRLPSGLGLVLLVGFLMLSGWGLYYIGDDRWRGWTGTAHWVVGLLAAVILIAHSGFGRPRANDGR
jgi:hypothetical protein